MGNYDPTLLQHYTFYIPRELDRLIVAFAIEHGYVTSTSQALRELIRAGLVAHGYTDARHIEDRPRGRKPGTKMPGQGKQKKNERR